jgi:hypothetical protein
VSPRRHTVGRSPICCAGDRETAKAAEYVGMGGRLARAARRVSYKASQESAVPSPESFGLKSVDALHAYDLNWSSSATLDVRGLGADRTHLLGKTGRHRPDSCPPKRLGGYSEVLGTLQIAERGIYTGVTDWSYGG